MKAEPWFVNTIIDMVKRELEKHKVEISGEKISSVVQSYLSNWDYKKEVDENVQEIVKRILEEKITKKSVNEKTRRVIDIYEWATKLSRETELNEPIFIPDDSWNKLVARLIYTHGNLIKVVGPQGAGKTTFAHFLLKKLEELKKNVAYYREVNEPKAFKHPESFDGTKVYVFDERVWEADTIIIDMWDCSKTSQKVITTALDAIQDLWWNRCYASRNDEKPPNIVVFLQKEALPLHFFLGKMSFFELKPWEPGRLVKAFKDRWGDTYPFTEEALQEIAYLSGGNFRRFKEYIASCLDNLLQDEDWEKKIAEGFIINLDYVKQVITIEKVTSDMELQLCEIFPRSKEHRLLSMKIMRYLREKGPTKQEVLTEEFFGGNKMAASRLLNALALHGYIKFKVEGREKVWSI